MNKTVNIIRNGGRPKVKDEDRKTERICFRVDSLTKEVIDQKVRESRLTMAEFIRRAIINSEITVAEAEGLFREITNFRPADLINFIAVSATVVHPWSNEEESALKQLYEFARHVKTLAERGGESLAAEGAEENVRINYLNELALLQKEFNEMKDYFIKRVIGEGRTDEAESKADKGDTEKKELGKEDLL